LPNTIWHNGLQGNGPLFRTTGFAHLKVMIAVVVVLGSSAGNHGGRE